MTDNTRLTNDFNRIYHLIATAVETAKTMPPLVFTSVQTLTFTTADAPGVSAGVRVESGAGIFGPSGDSLSILLTLSTSSDSVTASYQPHELAALTAVVVGATTEHAVVSAVRTALVASGKQAGLEAAGAACATLVSHTLGSRASLNPEPVSRPTASVATEAPVEPVKRKRKRRKRGHRPGTIVEATCEWCGRGFTRPRRFNGTNQHQCCSLECSYKHRTVKANMTRARKRVTAPVGGQP